MQSSDNNANPTPPKGETLYADENMLKQYGATGIIDMLSEFELKVTRAGTTVQ